MLFLEGALRLMPGWEVVVFGFTLSLNILVPGVVLPGILFTFLGAYPFIEAAARKDSREHHILDRPRNQPVRTAIGVAYLTAFIVIVLAGSNDIIATHFHMDIYTITWIFRVGLFLFPVIAFLVTKRICIGLQRRDRELVLHGHETGRVVQLESGEFMEVHRPLDEHELWTLVSYTDESPLEIGPAEDSLGNPRPGHKREAAKRKLSRFFFEDRVQPVTPEEYAAAQHHHAVIEHAPDHASIER